uniref:P-type ATPase N-terminal domain-containing protein n=1 Tax=Ictidomys tridecemlineatus TaxID=43179 RepID=A0A287CTA1_ICTTR
RLALNFLLNCWDYRSPTQPGSHCILDMTEVFQWARYHWQQLMGRRNRDDDERSYNYSSLLVCGAKSSQTPKLAGKHRVVIPHLWPFKDEYEKFSGTYVNNRIRTTKYTLLNFVPRNLFEQFHRAANLYFLFLVVLNWVPLVEAFQKEITMLPLVVVLTIIAIKDGLEDYRKYKIDKQINNLITKVYSR